MKLAIHVRQNSFSDRWIQYCKANQIDYKPVNAYDTDIMAQLADCDGLMWHWHHGSYRDQLFARQLTLALEASGKPVFPDSRTAWHFDDKVGQKYLFESLGIPTPNSYVFYDRESAQRWAAQATYPKVFKLRGGAGAQNVKLVKSAADANRLIQRAFGRGFPLIDRKSILEQAIWLYRHNRRLKDFLRVIKRIITLFLPSKNERLLPVQKGYIYFQDYVPNNAFDDRLVVIGDRCFCIRRYCRTDDFRASGSGIFAYEIELFPLNSVRLVFDVAKKMGAQCAAYDILYTDDGSPLIAEVSYGFRMGSAYDDCHGVYDANLTWHDLAVNPQVFMIEDFVASLTNKNSVLQK